ncbi:MAG TPA: CpsB/CapC family capsule biosynthesis tyrosine phosphatase [Tepidisphaeraceae bacterium]|jgi:protein-tyrosine phosphatase|nr:CpsB/CapC family capsule biosynthesis tyrosine phosphatase [Tepidisphaeraceae bacterium]
MTTGRIDIHSHLLPNLDDGCQSLEESLACARAMVAAGYTHSFCTPHVWTSLPNNNVSKIPIAMRNLQLALDDAVIPLKLLPGGENNFTELQGLWEADLVTYNMAGHYVLADIWVEAMPSYFYEQVKRLQDRGLTVVLAHPERMRAVQERPDLADEFADLGLLLQGNLQCFGDPPHALTRQVAELYLSEGRYTFLGSDLHNLKSLPIRLNGLKNAISLVGNEVVDQLTITNPQRLIHGIS